MALARHYGMALIELVIYIALSAAVILVAGSLFVLMRHTTETTNANYFLNADAETTVAWLRRDLQQACLASIQTYPGGNRQEPPGMSLCSTLESTDVKKIAASDSGTPRWSNHVYYTLQRNRDNVGRLVRWSQVMPEGSLNQPTLAPLLPSAIVKATSRTIHSRVVMPNQQLFGVKNPDGNIDEHGGFRLRFVRRSTAQPGKEELSDQNPAQISRQKATTEFRGNTRLVELELKFYSGSSTGKPSFYSLRFRICPRF